jgi:hypothetical protein
MLTPWIIDIHDIYSQHLLSTNQKCIHTCFIPLSQMLFRRWRRCGAPWLGVLLASIPVAWLCLWCCCVVIVRVVFSFYVIRQYSCNNVLWSWHWFLSDMLEFCPYVWQIDSRLPYDEHLVLALKLGVTKPNQYLEPLQISIPLELLFTAPMRWAQVLSQEHRVTFIISLKGSLFQHLQVV